MAQLRGKLEENRVRKVYGNVFDGKKGRLEPIVVAEEKLWWTINAEVGVNRECTISSAECSDDLCHSDTV